MTRRSFLGRRAFAALEFAMVAPFLTLMTFGVVEFAEAVRMQMGVNQTARVIADLISHQTDVTTAQLNDFYQAGLDCYSFNVGSLSISATSVNFSAGSQTGTVGWTANTVSGSFAAAPSNVTTLASGLAATSNGVVVGGDSTIVVQASTTFTVPVSFGPIAFSYTLTSTAFARPRLSYVTALN